MSKEAETIQLICEDCGGIMTIDKSRSVLSCPYCGSTKIVADSDEVKMERIRNERIKDIEIHKQNQEMEKWKAHEVERKKSIMYSIIFVVFDFMLLLILGLLGVLD